MSYTNYCARTVRLALLPTKSSIVRGLSSLSPSLPLSLSLSTTRRRSFNTIGSENSPNHLTTKADQGDIHSNNNVIINTNNRHYSTKIRTVIMRGGTSKGIFFHKNDLVPATEEYPSSSSLLDDVLCDIMGSPDIRQIDGLGGADALTSKVAIISRSERPDADIDYLFGQVVINKPNNNNSNNDDENNENNNTTTTTTTTNTRRRVLYDINCGNISAAVGPFAIDEGLLDDDNDGKCATIPTSQDQHEQHHHHSYRTVRIYNVNTDTMIIATVPIDPITGLSSIDDGRYTIDGVPGTANRIDLDFRHSVGTIIPNTIFPTGNRTDTIKIRRTTPTTPTTTTSSTVEQKKDGEDHNTVNDENEYDMYDVSFADVANPVIHINGLQLGLMGNEDSIEVIYNNEQLWKTVEQIRYEAARLVLDENDITITNPFTAIVLPPIYPYKTIQGNIMTLGSGQQRKNYDDDETNKKHDDDNNYYDENGAAKNKNNDDDDNNTISATTTHNVDHQQKHGSEHHHNVAVRSIVYFCGSPHKAYPGTASNATAVAAMIPGTVVHEMVQTMMMTKSTNEDKNDGDDNVTIPHRTLRDGVVTIGHPSGCLQVEVQVEVMDDQNNNNNKNDNGILSKQQKEPVLKRSVIGRTARRIMDGYVYLKPHTVQKLGRRRPSPPLLHRTR